MGNRLILILGVLSLAFLVVIVSSHSLYHYHHSVSDQKEKGWVLANTIAKSLELPMLEGEMTTVQEMLVTVGELENLKRIHLTDCEGIIRYSSIPSRINTPTGSDVIRRALTEKREVDAFEQRGADYIFSLALPIYNEKRCQSCHGNKIDILGVLRVGMDWEPIRKSLMTVLRRDVIVSVTFFVFIVVISILFQRLYNNAQQAYVHLQQTQQQLIKTEKMAAIGQMAAAISHDLRNPLTGIKMATYYLGSKIDKSEVEINSILQDIELEIDYASNVVTNILTYSRPTELIYTMSNINKIIEDTMHFVNLKNRDKGIELIKEYDNTIPEILLDNKKIKQIIVNLLSNSMQAMPNGGQLKIGTKLNQDNVQIIVSDAGSGIEKSVQERIFTPFFTTKARGVGLGLSIVNNIVQKHGGKIDLISEIDKGTVFTVTLPIRKQSDIVLEDDEHVRL
ncbi:MAG: GHKL domain-containing protein [Candidatus Omnitrophica bacterium]|nr:GHKL domain-containing protein [Candidatus Omnitrophota bacterium]